MRISDRDEWLFDDTVVTVVEAAPALGVSRWSAHRLARDRLIAGHHEYGFGRIRFFELGEAEKLDVTDGAWRYTRISGSKENYAPPPDKATWFRLTSVPLNNGTDDYPNGDEIGVATTWECRPMFEGMDFNQLKAVFDALRTTIHGPSKQGKHTLWAGQPLIDIGKRSDREASKIVKAWIDSGVLVEEEHANVHRNKTQKVTVIEAKAQSILADISVPIYPSD
jgi:hypothetical protein